MLDFIQTPRSFFVDFCLFLALLGSTVFLLNLLLSFLKSSELTDGIDTDASFKFMSIQGLSSFAMIFGWTGLAASLEFGVNVFFSGVAAAMTGAAAVIALRKIYSYFHKLHRTGTLDLANALLEQGTVYMRIPKGGVGKIQIPVQGRFCTLEAESIEIGDIETGTKVQVVEVSQHLLKVKKI